MTVIPEVRHVDDDDYQIVIPLQHASERAVEEHTADTLREYLHRHGASIARVSDDELLARVRHTFIDSIPAQRPGF